MYAPPTDKMRKNSSFAGMTSWDGHITLATKAVTNIMDGVNELLELSSNNTLDRCAKPLVCEPLTISHAILLLHLIFFLN